MCFRIVKVEKVLLMESILLVTMLCPHGNLKEIKLSNTINLTGAQDNNTGQHDGADQLPVFNQHTPVTGECEESSLPPGVSGRRVATQCDLHSEQYNGMQQFLLYACRQDVRRKLYTISEQEEYSIDNIATHSNSSNTSGTTSALTEFSELSDMTMTLISSNIFSDCLSSRTTIPTTLINAGEMHSSSSCINGNYPVPGEWLISIYEQSLEGHSINLQPIHNISVIQAVRFFKLPAAKLEDKRRGQVQEQQKWHQHPLPSKGKSAFVGKGKALAPSAASAPPPVEVTVTPTPSVAEPPPSSTKESREPSPPKPVAT